ncbi:hypothetical protein M426DRAFT_254518 [Hypoxylon sp. CI-4A]|nr:hypothetical protein M426DRAFT_254518 [Hypoxylon sp. CI-4A]
MLRLTGRWPWAVENVLEQYDIYGSHHKNIELFSKTQMNNHGNNEYGGIIWEWDPVRHRQVAKQLSPAFSGRALNAKEPTLHKYIDLFVERMEVFGSRSQGVSLQIWANWLCVYISADMAYRDKRLKRNEAPIISLHSHRIQQGPRCHSDVMALSLARPTQVPIPASNCDETPALWLYLSLSTT